MSDEIEIEYTDGSKVTVDVPTKAEIDKAYEDMISSLPEWMRPENWDLTGP